MLFSRKNVSPHMNEQGFVVPLFAAFSSLLVILLLGWCIELPTHNAAVVRNQFSADVSNATGLLKFWDPPVIPPAVNVIAASANYGTFTGSPGLFFNSIGKSAIGIPEQAFTSGKLLAGALCDNSLGDEPRCDETEPDVVANFRTNHDPFFSTQDGGGGIFGNLMTQYFNRQIGGITISDFRNGIVQYNHLTPYSYFNFLSGTNRNVSTVSAIRLANTMVGVLISPDVPMGYEEIAAGTPELSPYRQIFSEQEDLDKPDENSNYVFPLAAYRVVKNDPPQNPKDVTYPVLYGDPESSLWGDRGFQMFNVPVGLFDLPFAWDPKGSSHLSRDHDPALYTRVFNFFSANCDSLPFFYFKSAAVNLIDRLARSSAYSATTMIGLTGYEPRDLAADKILDDAVVPIFPSEYASGAPENYEKFVDPITRYPLQVYNTGGDIYLHRQKSTAFRGWALPASYAANEPDEPRSRSELLYCSDYYESGKEHGTIVSNDITGPITSEDFSSSSIDVRGFHHKGQEFRRRSSPLMNGRTPHWYDDDFNSESITASLNLHQSGNDEDGDGVGNGDTPRNIVAGLGIRMKTDIDKLVPPKNPMEWHRPDATTTEGVTGVSYLPFAIEKMCNQVKMAANSYNLDTAYGTARPVNGTAVVVYAFQLASRTALNNPAFGNRTIDNAIDDLENALKSCLCGSPNTKVIFALLPFDSESREQVTRMREVLYKLEQAHNAQCIGTPTNQCADGESQGAIFTLVYDWNSSQFGELPRNTPAEEAKAKLAAAEAFMTKVHGTIMNLLMQWLYVA
jgi:hypothetical protein